MANPVEMMVRKMMQQGGGNPQAMAERILKNNPQFANAIQGQNLQQMAINEMAKNGINPQMFMNGMFGKK